MKLLSGIRFSRLARLSDSWDATVKGSAAAVRTGVVAFHAKLDAGELNAIYDGNPCGFKAASSGRISLLAGGRPMQTWQRAIEPQESVGISHSFNCTPNGSMTYRTTLCGGDATEH